MGSHSRACDRCAKLKAQCSKLEPCGRCSRLDLECTYTRPALRRGRPRTNRPSTVLAAQSTQSSPFEDDESTENRCVVVSKTADLVETFSDPSLDLDLRVRCLDTALALAHEVGILAAFRRCHSQVLANENPIASRERDYELAFLRSRAIISTLVVCGMIYGPPLHCPEVFIEDSRMFALSDIPILTWKSRNISSSDIYCLCILSHVGYLQEELTDISFRWATLAEALWRTSLLDHISLGAPETELDQRIMSLVSINSEVKALLANEYWPVVAVDHSILGTTPHEMLPNMAFPSSGSSDQNWHQLSSTSPFNAELDSAYHIRLNEGFLQLFVPLATFLRTFRCRKEWVTRHCAEFAALLDEYFISFPTTLMNLALVKFPWQLEAMVWFHGIYLALLCGLDIVGTMMGLANGEATISASAVDHAVLLGDVLPFLLAMEFGVTRVSPLTIYFVCLSAAVHVCASRLLHNGSISLVLLRSARAHEAILSSIVGKNKACTHPLVGHVLGLLSNMLQAISQGLTFDIEDLHSVTHEMKVFRWVKGGRGLTRINGDAAATLFNELLSKVSNLDFDDQATEDFSRVLSSKSRINEPGTFDLSILI